MTDLEKTLARIVGSNLTGDDDGIEGAILALLAERDALLLRKDLLQVLVSQAEGA